VLASVGEAVGGQVEDGHDESARAEREGSGAEMPVVGGSWSEGHGGLRGTWY
jgi:hypothetical protein